MQAELTDDILGPKKMNYDFLLLVRDKKYPQALTLGKKILQLNPDNPSVQKFCAFIQKNNTQIIKMVQRQKQQELYESVDSDEQEQQEEAQGEQNQQGEQKSEESDKQDEQQEDEMEQQQQTEPKQKKQKIQLTTCTLNQIPHICPRHHKQKKLQTQQTVATQTSEIQKKE